MSLNFKPLAMSLALASISSLSAAQSSQNEQVLITATRVAEPAKDVLADNVVITAEQITNSGATTVVDLLQQQRGIEISRNGGAGNTASVFIRGASNAQSVVYIDGVRVGSATNGGGTWSSIPLAQIERIEIVYGPLSSLYGADAVGGVIQLFTKKSAQKTSLNVSYGRGSDGLRQWDFGVRSSAKRDFQYAFTTSKVSSEGFSATNPTSGSFTYNPDKDAYTQRSSSGSMSWRLHSDMLVGVTSMQSILDVMYDSGPTTDARGQQKLDTAAAFIKTKLAPNWSSQLQFSRTNDRVYSANGVSKTHAITKQDSVVWQNDIQLSGNLFQYVIERRDEDVKTHIAAIVGKRRSESLALAYVMKQDAHLLSMSGRMDRNDQYGSHRTGAVAYGLRLSPELRFNASVGTSYRAPTYNELFYPGSGVSSNKPELGKNKEIGLYYQGQDSQLSMVHYNNRITDLLVYTNVCPVEKASHPYGCSYNVNKAKLSGFTFNASTEVAGFNLRASFDMQDPVDETLNTRLLRRAKKHGTLGADYKVGALTLGLENVFSADRVDFGNVKLAGYGIVNLYARYSLSDNWSMLARLNNVADKTYALAKGYNTPKRNAFVSIRYGF
jgi:vitamin B12 transporter